MPRPEPDRLPPVTPRSPEVDEDTKPEILLHPEVPATERTKVNAHRLRRRIV